MSSAVAKRRAAAIHAYVGENGGGKSYVATMDTIRSLERGRRVCSNVLFLDPDRQASCEAEAEEAWAAHGITERPTRPLALPHPLWTPLNRWRHIVEFEHGDMFLDEFQSIADSRRSQALPGEVLDKFQQMRRVDVGCRWTTPAWARADVSMRQVTRAVTYCRGYMPERQRPCAYPCPSASVVDHECVEETLWGANRLFYWRTFNPYDFDEFTHADANAEHRKSKLRVLTRQFHWRPRGRVTDYYDTFAPVLSISEPNESGRCLSCGGNRRRPSCSCSDAGGEDRTAEPSDRSPRHRSEVAA